MIIKTTFMLMNVVQQSLSAKTPLVLFCSLVSCHAAANWLLSALLNVYICNLDGDLLMTLGVQSVARNSNISQEKNFVKGMIGYCMAIQFLFKYLKRHKPDKSIRNHHGETVLPSNSKFYG